MIKSMFNTFCKIITESLQDNATGRYSSARVIAMLVAFAATVFMWKLVILGGMSIDYFVAYLAYGTGTAGLNKFLDNKDNSRTEQAKALLPVNPMNPMQQANPMNPMQQANPMHQMQPGSDPSLKPPKDYSTY